MIPAGYRELELFSARSTTQQWLGVTRWLLSYTDEYVSHGHITTTHSQELHITLTGQSGLEQVSSELHAAGAATHTSQGRLPSPSLPSCTPQLSRLQCPLNTDYNMLEQDYSNHHKHPAQGGPWSTSSVCMRGVSYIKDGFAWLRGWLGELDKGCKRTMTKC